jgi:protein gp37
MAENSKIEWTDHTFNPWTGCTKVSPGCDHCYAEGWAKRSGTVQWGDAPRRRTTEANWRLPLKWNAQAERESRRFRVFCASLADVFDNAAPPAWRQDLMSLIVRTPHLDWLLLTKRIGNAKRMLSDASMHDSLLLTANDEYRPPDNLWIGATIVNREERLRDAAKLKATPASVRFWSVEPLLEDMGDIPPDLLPDWVIVGGESGPGARPMHPDWARNLRDQCAAAGVPFLFKQWGEWSPGYAEHGNDPGYEEIVDAKQHEWPEGHCAFRVGKKAAGRLLDGRTHDEFPELSPSDAGKMGERM